MKKSTNKTATQKAIDLIMSDPDDNYYVFKCLTKEGKKSQVLITCKTFAEAEDRLEKNPFFVEWNYYSEAEYMKDNNQ